ncbi:MAG: DUF427 domain-containing protein [Chloroflexi bacterium]|nr:DUF427 domain-containing protein [Chloroflexota bacterium]
MAVCIQERQNSSVIASGDESAVLEFEGAWYFMPEDVNMDYLRFSDRTYTCPYKGVCYWIDLELPSGQRAKNVGWVYRQPKAGYEFIKDRIGFYGRDTAGLQVSRV